jgi:hypothetical protein
MSTILQQITRRVAALALLIAPLGAYAQVNPQGEKQAAQGYLAEASADKTAATGSDISAIISGVAGIAGIFEGNPMATISSIATPWPAAPRKTGTRACRLAR